ncbi:MAG: hypothetical protein WCJ19_00495 [bacterium]
MKTKLPYKTFNLFYTYNAEEPFVDKLYKWIVSVGRYIVIGVEMVVLSAFVARFFLDQNLNDLTEKINDRNLIIKSKSSEEKIYLGIFSKIQISKNLDSTYSGVLMGEMSKFFSLAPKNVIVSAVSYSLLSSTDQPLIKTEAININGRGTSDALIEYKSSLSKNILASTPNSSGISILEQTVSTASDGLSDFTFKITRK